MAVRTTTGNYYDRSWFNTNYPYQISVPNSKTYSYYQSILKEMEVDRPLYNRYIGSNDEHIYGFQNKKDAFYFALVVGGSESGVQVMHMV